MAVKSEQVEKNLVKLTFEVTPEKFEEGIKAAYNKNKKRFNIPGFRKGKVTLEVVEKMYGKEVFYDDAINYVLPEAYENAVKEAELAVVGKPEIDVETIKSGENVCFTALVATKPEVKLGDYKGIEIEKIEYNVTDEDINKRLEDVQKKNARIIPVEGRAVQSGDITVIDFEGFSEGKAFEGGKGTNYELEIGSNTFIPGFEDQLIGAEVGKETEVNVTFPEEYHAPALAGKDAVFKVTVHEIKVHEYSEIDDDFASEVSEFDTLEEYKNSLKEEMEKANEQRAKTEIENAVIKKVVENSEMDIPEPMIKEQIDVLIQDMAQRLMYQGLNLKSYMQHAGLTREGLENQFRDQAVHRIEASLVLEAIGKAENIEVNPEEVEAHIKKTAEAYKMEFDKLKELIRPEEMKSIEEETLIEKTVTMLVNNAVMK
ncbi:MAG: trigger factor [Oscillospiraceae bacterium]|nr:trigger factor [Oscillospiraceae bacterium]